MARADGNRVTCNLSLDKITLAEFKEVAVKKRIPLSRLIDEAMQLIVDKQKAPK